MVHIAVLGYGTVGSGIVEVLSKNEDSINKKAGKKIHLKYVLDLKEFPGSPIEDILTDNFEQILNDDEVKVIAEVMGGIEPAYTFVKSALNRGKSVVTSNKELVAKHGPELLELARSKNINFMFEASVGGGIPIIRPLNQSLTADEIFEITGILNGTTNFILTKMSEEGMPFDAVLKEAQEKGYAERNPEADIEGYDASRKIAILASLAFGMHVDYEDIYTEGITRITARDMEYAKALGMDIKLLASSKKVDDKVYSFVAPMLIDQEHPLSHVHGVFNAILVKGNVIGDVMFYGKGAGKLPTASAVVSDIVDCIKHLNRSIMSFWSTKKMDLMTMENAPMRFFIVAKTKDEVEAKKHASELFGEVNFVSLQEQNHEIAFITHLSTEGNLKDKIKLFGEERSVERIVSQIRIG